MLEYGIIGETLGELRQGGITLVTDNENCGNEGDFICTAEFTTMENVNFVAIYGKGLICMPMSEALCQKLQFPQMVNDGKDSYETALTVSVDHTGIITEISAAERSTTIIGCVEENAELEDFRRPGYVFPLTVRGNGVLEWNRHTEATVDLMRLTGLKECDLCCEIMRENGTMMRTPELMELVRKWGLKMITIKVLQEYRKRNDELVGQAACASPPTKYGDFRTHRYINRLNGKHHVALMKGETGDGRNLLCRVHSECLTGGMFGSERCDCGQQFATAMAQTKKEGRGILLCMRQEDCGIGLIGKLRAYTLQDQGMDTPETNLALGFSGDLREYFIGAQILCGLGARTLRLLTNNPGGVYQLSSLGMEIVQRVPVQMDATAHDLPYLKTEQEKAGHLLNL